jgi:hypothetical protein
MSLQNISLKPISSKSPFPVPGSLKKSDLVSALGQKNAKAANSSDSDKKKSQKNYILLGVAGVCIGTVLSLLALNRWKSGTFSSSSDSYTLPLDVEVPVLTDDGISIPEVGFLPKSFVPLVALSEAIFFLKKATLGITAENLKSLAQTSPIVAYRFIKDFAEDMQEEIQKVVATSLICMKNTGSWHAEDLSDRVRISAALAVYPKYDEKELADRMAECGSAYDESSVKGYLQALKSHQKINQLLEDKKVTSAIESAEKISDSLSWSGAKEAKNQAYHTIASYLFLHADGSYENDSVKTSSYDAMTEIFRILSKKYHAMDLHSNDNRSKAIEKVLKLYSSKLSLEQLKLWNDLILPPPRIQSNKDGTFAIYNIELETDSYRNLLPSLLENVVVDQGMVDMLLASWEGKDSLALESEYLLFTRHGEPYGRRVKTGTDAICSILHAYLNSNPSPDKYISFLDMVQDIDDLMSSQSYRWDISDLFSEAAIVFVDHYKKIKNKETFTFDQTCIDKIRNRKNHRSMASYAEFHWLYELQKAFHRAGCQTEVDLIANQAMNRTPQTSTAKLSDSSTLKIQTDLDRYREDPESKEKKDAAAESLFEFFPETPRQDSLITLWKAVEGKLTKAELGRLWRAWTPKYHSDRNLDGNPKFVIGAAVHDLLEKMIT